MTFPGPNATRKEIAAFFKSNGLDHNGQTIWIEFNDWNCNNYKTADEEPCRGWDGKSGRCDCGSRRVYWSEDEETGDKISMAD